MPSATRLATGAIAGLLVTGLASSGALAASSPDPAPVLHGSTTRASAAEVSRAGESPSAPVVHAQRVGVRAKATAEKTVKAAPTLSEQSGLTVTIDSMSPATLTPGSRLQMSGTITNQADHGWFNLKTYLEMGTTPATTKGVLDSLATTGDLAFGTRVLEIPFFDELGRLRPGESTTYHLSVPYNLLPADKAVGVYQVGATVLGTQPGVTRDVNADARAVTTIPLVNDTSPTQATRIVTMIPFTAPVARQPDGSFVDDRLAAEFGDGGRLDNLLAFAAAAPTGSVEAAVDPALLDAVTDMSASNGYQVQSMAAARNGDPPHPGAGQAAASQWLAEFGAVESRQSVTLLPWGTPDSSGLAENDVPGVVAAAVRASRRYAFLNLLPNTIMDWQNNGASSRRGLTVADAARADLHVVSQSSLTTLQPVDENGYPPPWVSVNTRSSLPVDTVVTRVDVGGQEMTPTTTALQLRQNILAEATVRAISSTDAPVSVVAAPFHWDPGPVPADLDLAAAFASTAMQPSLLAPIVATPALPYVGPVLPIPASPGYSADLIRAIRRLHSVGKVYTDLLSVNRVVTASFDQQLAMSGSAAWQWRPKRGQALTRRDANVMAKQIAQVTVSGPDFVALSSDSGRFPLTVDNGLDVPVTVTLRVVPANPALSFDDLQPFVVDAQSKQDVEVVSQASGSGVTSVRARLATSDQRAFGRAWTFDVRATRIGVAIWILMGVLGALLFSSAAVRIVRRFRAGGFTPRGEQP